MASMTIELRDEGDVVAARQAARRLASQLGFGLADQTRLATAVSELARNVIQHAGVGVCVLCDASDSGHVRVRAVLEDHGPGIPDVELAMRQGYSTAQGLGAGLPGARRLVHEFAVDSEPGHTKVTIGLARRRPSAMGVPVS